MRKVVAIVGIFLIIGMTIGVPGKFVKAEKLGRIILFDDFEKYPVRTFPSNGGWRLVWDGVGIDHQVITDAVSYSGSKSLQLWGHLRRSAVAEHRFSYIANVIGFEAKVYIENFDKSEPAARLAFWNGDLDLWGRYYAGVLFRGDGKVIVGSNSVAEWEPKRWYTVKLVLDRHNKIFSVYIDGKLVAENVPAYPYGLENLNAVALVSDHGEVKVYYDDVKVFEMSSYDISFQTFRLNIEDTLKINDILLQFLDANKEEGKVLFKITFPDGSQEGVILNQGEYLSDKITHPIEFDMTLISVSSTGEAVISFFVPKEYQVIEAKGILNIYSTPLKADVYLNGDWIGQTPIEDYQIVPGTYEVKITKDKYEDYITTITVNIGDEKQIMATLTPKHGYLTVYSTPASADVYRDGEYIGTTPITNYKLPVGTYSLKVTKVGYNDYTSTVTIEAGKTEVVNVELVMKTATLVVSSTPSGASVYIGGEYKGQTPLTLNVPPGTYTVEIRKTDYKPHTETITLQAGEERQINVQLEALFGFLNVYSNVQGASVYIDGKKIGETPLKEYKISTGSHKVEVKKEGYQIFTQTITIEPTKTYTINARLEPISINLTSSSPTSPVESLSYTKTARAESILTTITRPPAIYGVGIVLLLLLGLVIIKSKYKGKPTDQQKPITASQEVKGKNLSETPKMLPEKPLKDFPPELLDKYEPLEFIGEGGFAKVFKAKRKSDGEIVALKIPRIDEKTSSLFLKEIATWYHLDHPNIVRLYKADILPVSYLEMEYVEGVTLNGKLIRDLDKYPKPVDEKTALKLIKGIANGLAHAHSKGIYHLDLKPLNVLLKSDLTPKITDWGLAKISARSSLSTHKGYSPLYAAPEQLDESLYGTPDHRTDIYQLGVILYELLTGRLPYEGYSPGAVIGKILAKDIKPLPPSKVNPRLAKYDGIFEKLLAKRKEERYQSVEEFLLVLDSIEELHKELEELKKTKETLKKSRSKEEIRRLRKEAVEKTAKIATLSARLNDKVELLNALEDLKVYTRENLDDLLSTISQVEVLMKEGIPISNDLIERLRVLLHRIEMEVQYRGDV